MLNVLYVDTWRSWLWSHMMLKSLFLTYKDDVHEILKVLYLNPCETLIVLAMVIHDILYHFLRICWHCITYEVRGSTWIRCMTSLWIYEQHVENLCSCENQTCLLYYNTYYFGIEKVGVMWSSREENSLMRQHP